MAYSRILIASLLLFLLTIHAAKSKSTDGENQAPVAAGLDCTGACEVRCSESSRPNLCKRACGTCCSRCRCVPEGTYGNYNSCPCYATMTTRGGVRKCP